MRGFHSWTDGRGLRSIAADWLHAFEDLVLPDTCQGCAAEVQMSELPGLCLDCSRQVSDFDGVFQRPWWPDSLIGSRYRTPVSDLVYQLKYGLKARAARPLAALIVRAAKRRWRTPPVDVLVPVPSHRLKRWSRGLDPAEEIARALSESWRIPFRTDLLVRHRITIAQGQARRIAQRISQVQNAFRVRTPWLCSAYPPRLAPLAGLRVGLVDDVVTSGATLEACTFELLKAGAAQVLPLVAAAAFPG